MKTLLAVSEAKKIISEEIGDKMSPHMTFTNIAELSATFTWGFGVIPQSDIMRIVAVCKIYNLSFVIRERAKTIDVEIDYD